MEWAQHCLANPGRPGHLAFSCNIQMAFSWQIIQENHERSLFDSVPVGNSGRIELSCPSNTRSVDDTPALGYSGKTQRSICIEPYLPGHWIQKLSTALDWNIDRIYPGYTIWHSLTQTVTHSNLRNPISWHRILFQLLHIKKLFPNVFRFLFGFKWIPSHRTLCHR